MQPIITKTTKLEKIIENNRKFQKEKLKNQWIKDIEESNKIISKIKDTNDYIERNEKEINRIIERLNKEIDYYSELGIQLEEDDENYKFSEIRRNLEKNYRTLSLEFYKYNFNKIQSQNAISEEKLSKLIKSQNMVEDKMANVDSRIEGLGATFLNMVLTISIITSMVTVLLNTSPMYSIIIVLVCTWLLLTSIIFVGSYFKSAKTKDNISKTVYIILTVFTFIALAYGIYTSNASNKKVNVKKNLAKNTTIIIDNTV